MTGEPDLISLLYRADWTRLSLAAELSDGSSLLVAPGRRYRLEYEGDHGGRADGSDGDHAWTLRPPDAAPLPPRDFENGPGLPVPALFRPAGLLARFTLDVGGPVTRGFGSLRVEVEVGPIVWRTSIFPGDTGYALPIKKAVRTANDADLGDVLHVRLTVLDL